MNKLLNSTAAVLIAAAGLNGAFAAPLSASAEKNVLFITETVSPSGATSVSAKTGPLTTSERGFGIDRLGSRAAPGITPAQLPAIAFDGGFGTTTGLPSRGQVLDIANERIRSNFPFLNQSMSTYMKRNGLSSAWFNFKQEVRIDVNGAAETWAVYWDYFSDQTGRGAYADARLVPPNPRTLYVIYTPNAVDKDLPANWAYNGGGTLQYQLRDMKFQAVSDWVTVDVGGLYDNPQTDTENLDTGVKCLMDNANPGCPVGATDVKRLLDSSGAVMAVVDYVRRLEPVLDEDNTTNPPTYTPHMVTSVDRRDLTYSGCLSPVFRNTGQFGYELSQAMGRYIATSSGSPRNVLFQQIQEYKGTTLSPTQAFDYSLKVRKADAPGLGSYAIDPVKGGTVMLASEIPGLISLAGLNVIGSPSPVLGSATGAYWQYGGRDDEYQVTWSVRCSSTNEGYEIATVIESARHWNGWHPNQVITSPVSDSAWSPIALADFAPNRYLAYADTASGIVRLIEGAQYGGYAYRSSGGYEGSSGDFVCGHNMWSMQQQGRYGNYSCWSPNTKTWNCGASRYPYHYYYDGQYQGLKTNVICTGHTFLRGFYMSNGAPYWVDEVASTDDPSLRAVYSCDDYGQNCGYYVWEYSGYDAGGGG